MISNFQFRDSFMNYINFMFKSEDIIPYIRINADYEEKDTISYDDLKFALTMSSYDVDEILTKKLSSKNGIKFSLNPLVGENGPYAFRNVLLTANADFSESIIAFLTEHRFPAICVVGTNDKLYTIIKVDACEQTQYKERIDVLKKYFDDNKLNCISNISESHEQFILFLSIDAKCQIQRISNPDDLPIDSWDAWQAYKEISESCLPSPMTLTSIRKNHMIQQPELIAGIFRCRQKMLISGAPKAGKSFLLIELALAMASGTSWLGYSCRQSKMLYMNLEIDEADCQKRIIDIANKTNFPKQLESNLQICNLRGKSISDNKLLKYVKNAATLTDGIDAIIIDPVYKIMEGDKNSAAVVGKFFLEIDKIVEAVKCDVIVCHHFLKGANQYKDSMNRSAGSNTFARDPDAVISITPLALTPELEKQFESKKKAYFVETTSRSFPEPKPKQIIFDYPIHMEVTDGSLDNLLPASSNSTNLYRSSKRAPDTAKQKAILDSAFRNCLKDGVATIKEMAQYASVDPKTIKNYIIRFSDIYACTSGVVSLKTPEQK